MMTDELLSSDEVCELTGLSFRQLDYYAHHGVFDPVPQTRRGSGIPRRWRRDQVGRMMAVAAVSQALRGSSVRDKAGSTELYRQVADRWDQGLLELSPQVMLIWEVPTWPST